MEGPISRARGGGAGRSQLSASSLHPAHSQTPQPNLRQIRSASLAEEVTDRRQSHAIRIADPWIGFLDHRLQPNQKETLPHTFEGLGYCPNCRKTVDG